MPWLCMFNYFFRQFFLIFIKKFHVLFLVAQLIGQHYRYFLNYWIKSGTFATIQGALNHNLVLCLCLKNLQRKLLVNWTHKYLHHFFVHFSSRYIGTPFWLDKSAASAIL